MAAIRVTFRLTDATLKAFARVHGCGSGDAEPTYRAKLVDDVKNRLVQEMRQFVSDVVEQAQVEEESEKEVESIWKDEDFEEPGEDDDAE